MVSWCHRWSISSACLFGSSIWGVNKWPSWCSWDLRAHVQFCSSRLFTYFHDQYSWVHLLFSIWISLKSMYPLYIWIWAIVNFSGRKSQSHQLELLFNYYVRMLQRHQDDLTLSQLWKPISEGLQLYPLNPELYRALVDICNHRMTSHKLRMMFDDYSRK